MVVERRGASPRPPRAPCQSLCWGSSAFGGIVSAYSSGALVETYGTRWGHQYPEPCTRPWVSRVECVGFGVLRVRVPP